jgi:TP901 family phage tail tape measure protein
MASPAAILQILVTANTAQAVTGLKTVDAQAKRTAATSTSATSRMSSGFSKMASVAKTALVGGVAYGLYSGVKAGIEFEKQMDAVGAVADASSKQMRKLEAQALKLGQATTFSASEAAAAQEELAKGGLKASDILGGALKSSLSLAAAGQLDLATAAETTVNSMKLFNIQAKDAGKVADTFATAANTTTADVEDFAMALKQGGSAAQAAGYDFNQTIVVLEALAESGIKNSDAGTSMKTAFLQLLAPTDKQKKLAEQLNIQWVNQAGNLKDAAGLSKELQDALGGMTNAQQAQNLKLLAGTDGFRTLNSLLDAGPAKLDKLAAANEKQGTAQEIAKKKMDNTAGSIEQLQGAWETLSISLFKSAQSPFRSIIDSMTEGVQDFTDVVTDKSLTGDEKISKVLDMISEAIQKAIPKVAGAAAKIGGAIAKGIANAFIQGDILTKLFIGAGLWRMFGGEGALTTAGKKIGGKLGIGMGTAIGVGTVLMIGAQRKEIIDALVPEGGIRDALHRAFDSSTVGGKSSDDGWLSQVEHTWDAITGTTEAHASKLVAIQNGVTQDTRKELSKRLALWVANGHKINDSVIWGWAENKKISAEGASRLIDILENVKKKGGDALVELAHTHKWLGGVVSNQTTLWADHLRGFSEKSIDLLKKVSKAFKDPFMLAVDSTTHDVKDATKDMADKFLDFADKADKATDKAGNSFDKLGNKSTSLKQKVAGNIMNLASTVTSGLGIIVNNTNKALKGFGVKKVAISLSNVGEAAKGFQTGGVIVPGQGDGDKIPAMLEPGEVVWNKKAVAAMGGAGKANKVNSMVPRFATGGIVPIAGMPGEFIHQSIAGDVQSLIQKYKLLITDGYAPTGHDPNGEHPLGLAIDAVPGAGGSWGLIDQLARWAEPVQNQPIDPFRWVGYNGDAGHGTGDHIHLSWLAGHTIGKFGGAIAEQIKRVLLQGPDGPLKDMGQSALDKVRDAANKFIASKMPTGTGIETGGSVSAKSLPSSLEKYNHTYSTAMFPSSAWSNLATLPFSAVAALAEWAGGGRVPGVTMAQLSEGEGNLRPGSESSDGGHGMWGYTPSAAGLSWLSGIKGANSPESVHNPIIDAQVMAKMYPTGWSGGSPWYGSGNITGYDQHYSGPLLKQLGGIIPHLAKGTKGGDGAKKGGKFFDLIERIQTRIKRIAKIDERYGIAEREAGADWSPARSDYDQGEVDLLVSLKKRALGNMLDERKFVEAAQKMSGKKVKHLKHRVNASPLAQDLAKHHRKVKNLREDLGDVGHGKLGELRDRLKNAHSQKDKEAIQKQIDQVTKANSKEIEAIQHQIDKEQKVIGKLREKQQERKGRLTKRMGKFKSRDDWLAEQLEVLQGVTGKGGDIADTRYDIRQLRGSVTQPDKTAQIADLTELLNQANARYAVSQAQYGVLGAMAKGGNVGRTGPYLVGERGPEVVGLRSGQHVTPNDALGNVNVSVVMYEDRKRAMVDVNGREFEVAVEKVNRKQARKGGRVLPGRAGS